MKALTKLTVISIIFLFLAFFGYSAQMAAVAQAANDTVTVDVNISASSEIIVLPTSISWTLLSPDSNSSFVNISIQNSGSNNVTNLYVTTSTFADENTNPLGSGNITYHSATGFVMVRNSTIATQFYHAGRLEWNISTVLPDEVLNLGAGVTNFGHGWYRTNDNGNFYLWRAENGTFSGGYCNASDTNFVILNAPENASGKSRDMSSGTTTGSFEANNSQWSTFTLSGGPLQGHCVATYYTCDRIFIYKYDRNSTFPSCSDAKYLNDGIITPGSTDYVTVYAAIPRGTPAGDASQGILTFLVT